MSQLIVSFMSALQNAKSFLPHPTTCNFTMPVRFASKKSSGNSKNVPIKRKPKHRGIKYGDGCVVTSGTSVVTQRTTRFHPGLNVGFGRNGTLYAMENGKVMVTCEKINANWNHSWVMKNYEERMGQVFYKKYFNVIPNPQHKRFKLIDTI